MIEPTHKEIMRELKQSGCTWAYGQGCECHTGIKNQGCYDKAKERLTRKPELSANQIIEVQKHIEQSQNSAQNSLKIFFSEFN